MELAVLEEDGKHDTQSFCNNFLIKQTQLTQTRSIFLRSCLAGPS